MSDKVLALIEEFNDQIRIAPRLIKERAGLPGRPSLGPEGPVMEKPGDHYGGLRSVVERRHGSLRAR